LQILDFVFLTVLLLESPFVPCQFNKQNEEGKQVFEILVRTPSWSQETNPNQRIYAPSVLKIGSKF